MRSSRDLVQRFEELRNDALRKAEKAAKAGNTRDVNLYGNIADQCENAIKSLHSLIRSAERLEELLRAASEEGIGYGPIRMQKEIIAGNKSLITSNYPAYRSRENVDFSDASPSKRSEGAKARGEWIAKVQSKTNIEFRKEGSVTYRVGNQGLLGIAYASELTDYPDSWSLGLPDGDGYDVVVLLCRARTSQQLLDFVIPFAFLGQDWWRLSRYGKQVKINVVKDDAEYHLRIPKAGKRNIGNYQHNLEALEKLAGR